MPIRLPSWWTDARVEELKARWNNRESFSQICLAMGATSRNAVIGKAHRLNLVFKRTAAMKPRLPRIRAKRKSQAMPKPYASVPEPELPPIFAKPKLLLALGPDDCRWPGAGRGAELQYCAAPVADGRSYCAAHCRIAYVRSLPRLVR